MNAVTRSLERLSKKGKPSTAPLANATKSSLDDSSNEKDGLTVEPKVSSDNKHLAPVDAQFSAIFVPRSSQPPILHSHLPQLVATASLAYPDSSPIRLVSLPKGSEGQLCAALGLPSVSFIGLLEGAPHCKSLVDLFRECVPEIEVPWLDELKEPKYRPVKINAIDTSDPEIKRP